MGSASSFHFFRDLPQGCAFGSKPCPQHSGCCPFLPARRPGRSSSSQSFTETWTGIVLCASPATVIHVGSLCIQRLFLSFPKLAFGKPGCRPSPPTILGLARPWPVALIPWPVALKCLSRRRLRCLFVWHRHAITQMNPVAMFSQMARAASIAAKSQHSTRARVSKQEHPFLLGATLASQQTKEFHALDPTFFLQSILVGGNWIGRGLWICDRICPQSQVPANERTNYHVSMTTMFPSSTSLTDLLEEVCPFLRLFLQFVLKLFAMLVQFYVIVFRICTCVLQKEFWF